MKGRKFFPFIFPSFEPVTHLLHVPPLFPFIKMVLPPQHHFLSSPKAWCSSFKGKKGSFERLLEAFLHGASSLWFRITWSTRPPLIGSPFHLIHHFLNHLYPPMPLNTDAFPMGKMRNNCVEHPNSIKIILELLEEK